jgi:hypothetical protein
MSILISIRSNVRGEDARLCRLQMSSESGALLFREYLGEANDLARMPRFYNTATSNCTTLVFDMVRVIHPGLPLDYRGALQRKQPHRVRSTSDRLINPWPRRRLLRLCCCCVASNRHRSTRA